MKSTLHSALCTLRLIFLCSLLSALCTLLLGCANRYQHAADKSLLIQENLQLDQALSITQYELMLVQQENDALRRQLDRAQNTGNGTSGSASNNVSNGRIPPLRSGYEPMGPAPTFDAHNPNLPPPSNQVPQQFQRPLQNPPQNPPPITPTGMPQWSPRR